jgi:serine/threonine protein kinase/tetratricopeptide (TPR) repeat protein
MVDGTKNALWTEVEDYVEAFEAAHAKQVAADVADFLPARDHPHYLAILTELVRIDLEYGWQRGARRPLQAYLDRFPELVQNSDTLQAVRFEDFRLRRLGGEDPSWAEYQGARTSQDSANAPADTEVVACSNPLEAAAAAYQAFRRRARGSGAPSDSRSQTQFGSEGAANVGPSQTQFGNEEAEREGAAKSDEYSRVFKDIYTSDPEEADRLAEAVTSMPAVGSRFLGFHLEEELGRGAFGRVFLARQGDLANRPVALKVSTDLISESANLAQLQHTNIVPICSMHRKGALHAVCMPFLGSTTLYHVLDHFQQLPSMPISGKEFVSTVQNRLHSTRPGRSSVLKPEEAPPDGLREHTTDSKELPLPDEPPAALKKLEGMSYVEAVLWIVARLADGLAHAHARGILHRDIKPANVLLTDDGEPVLLDFNLSEDTKLRAHPAAAQLGGTLPYMAPEHLQVFLKGTRRPDARGDIYSLGILLYELLTGHLPFPLRRGVMKYMLTQMVTDRQGLPATACAWNKAVTPAVESIIRHCLDPRPEHRYQTAAELHEDLERQRTNQRLKYAPDPSVKERFRKWVRRHPRLTSATSVAAASLVVILGLAAAAAAGYGQLGRLQARANFAEFRTDLHGAQVYLCGHTANREFLDKGLAHCRRALDRYDVDGAGAWQELPAVRNLPREQQEELGPDVGELLFLSVRAGQLRSGAEPQAPEQLRRALSVNERAAACFGDDDRVPGALWQQRGELLAMLGSTEAAELSFQKARLTPRRTARDHYLDAQILVKKGDYRGALLLLEEAIRQDPQDFSSWWVKGSCHDALQQYSEAAGCYSTCIALRPDFEMAWLNRGLAYLHQESFAKNIPVTAPAPFWDKRRSPYYYALIDFDQAITLKPDWGEAYINRALAREGMNEYPEAIKDLTRALELKPHGSQVYFLRAVVREKAKDLEGAKKDREEGLRLTPEDEVSWITRGLARMKTDPKGALADIEEALKLNPMSYPALQNKAHILGELVHNDKEAVAVLDRAIDLYPDCAPLHGGRGVHLARLGKRQAALKDAQKALSLDTEPPNLYQVGCIYALTSGQQAGDRWRAFELLARALQTGFGLLWVDQDTDLNPIRNYKEFRQLVQAARDLQQRREANRP